MAFATNTSRFSFLTDDAPDPYETKKKANKNKNQTADGNKPGNVAAQSKKNKKKPASANSNSNSTQKTVAANAVVGAAGKPPNVNLNTKHVDKEVKHDKSWIEWEKRDAEFVSGSFETDLEQALAQSKLDFQKEQTRILAEANAKGTKSKKKAPVSLSQFQVMLNNTNGIGVVNRTTGVPLIAQDDDVLMHQFRIETQLELEREKQQAAQRALIESRNMVFSTGSTSTASINEQLFQQVHTDDKDATIAQLTIDKQHIEKEFDLLKNRFKKLCSVLSDAELKEKVGLIRDIENMTKVNQDLTEQIRAVCSELEQEKSRSHAAVTELRKVLEQNRRRTQSQTENM